MIGWVRSELHTEHDRIGMAVARLEWDLMRWDRMLKSVTKDKGARYVHIHTYIHTNRHSSTHAHIQQSIAMISHGLQH